MDPVQAADSVLGRVGHRQAVNLDLKLGRSAADDHQRLLWCVLLLRDS